MANLSLPWDLRAHPVGEKLFRAAGGEQLVFSVFPETAAPETVNYFCFWLRDVYLSLFLDRPHSLSFALYFFLYYQYFLHHHTRTYTDLPQAFGLFVRWV